MVGPAAGCSVTLKQSFVGRSACGKCPACGEQELMRHIGGVAVTVAGAGICGFGGASGVADLFHNVEQVDAF